VYVIRDSELIVVIDTETTGLDPKTGCIVEVAALADNGRYYSTLVHLETSLSHEAAATNYITSDMLGDAPRLKAALDELRQELGATGDNVVYAAHNASFDRGFLGELLHGRWLCTMRCAKHIWPGAPSYKNNVLHFWLGLEPKFPLLRPGELMPHTALYDVCVTKALLDRMLESTTIEALLTLQHQPVLLKTVRFGKHRGEEWNTVPRSYLEWAARNITDDIDVAHTIEYWRRMK